jgi:hypothetical protein
MTKDQAESELNLDGKTLQVYIYLLRKREPKGIREIQRNVRLSSPSVAEYQVEKLVELGIAEKDQYGRVRITKKAKVRALKTHLTVGRFIFPRLLLYAATFTAVAVAYALMSGSSFTVYGLAVPLSAAGLFWFETARSWQVYRRESAKKDKGSIFWISLAPGAAAVVVFISAAIFLSAHSINPIGDSRYMPTPTSPGDPPLGYVPTPPPTVDDFVQTTNQRAHLIDNGGVSVIPHLSPELIITLALAGGLAMGFLGYMVYSLRGEGHDGDGSAVLNAGQSVGSPFGTQRYPNWPRYQN